ncbi:MAG: hypothetical protein CM15mP25_2200 [Gammaproteobacteria bacterium]|nr:MAG: hypothetical protein CM15mP25_2200 [Gammaproteobacteria bacterium]
MAEKAAALADLPLSWHFIGPIQSNKTALIAEVSDWVHSIDRLKVARRLSEQRPDGKAPLNVLVQINTSNEDSKSGVRPNAAPELMAAINELPGLRLRGLMTIPAATHQPDRATRALPSVKELMNQLSDSLPQLDTLSMGMSGDLEAAVSEGANIVRVGTDILGRGIIKLVCDGYRHPCHLKWHLLSRFWARAIWPAP